MKTNTTKTPNTNKTPTPTLMAMMLAKNTKNRKRNIRHVQQSQSHSAFQLKLDLNADNLIQTFEHIPLQCLTNNNFKKNQLHLLVLYQLYPYNSITVINNKQLPPSPPHRNVPITASPPQ